MHSARLRVHQTHAREYPVQTTYRLLDVAPSGHYKWLHKPVSDRALENTRLLRPIRSSYKASRGIYGAPRICLDLRDAGETCGKHRVERIMRSNKITTMRGYRTRHYSVGKPSVVISKLVKRKFDVPGPNMIWGTDIIYIRTWDGWL
jgi:putative transposase